MTDAEVAREGNLIQPDEDVPKTGLTPGELTLRFVLDVAVELTLHVQPRPAKAKAVFEASDLLEQSLHLRGRLGLGLCESMRRPSDEPEDERADCA